MSGWGPGRVIDSFDTNVSLGLVPGYNVLTISGRSLGLVQSSFVSVWDGQSTIGTWMAPTADRIHDLVSTNANDTLAGVGAQKVLVQGVSGGFFTTEIVEMAGLSNSPTANAYDMIHRMDVVQSGVDHINDGDISATAQTDTTVTALMLTGNNRTFSCIYKTPSNEVLLLDQFLASVERSTGGGTDSDFRIVSFLEDLEILTASVVISTSAAGTTAIDVELKYGSRVPPNTYLIGQAAPTQTATTANIFMRGIRVKI